MGAAEFVLFCPAVSSDSKSVTETESSFAFGDELSALGALTLKSSVVLMGVRLTDFPHAVAAIINRKSRTVRRDGFFAKNIVGIDSLLGAREYHFAD